MISIEEVKKLARLARISVPPGELDRLRTDVDGILAYVEQIKNVSGSATESWEPAIRNVMREDSVTSKRGEYKETLLRASPETEDGFVKVKKIL